MNKSIENSTKPLNNPLNKRSRESVKDIKFWNL